MKYCLTLLLATFYTCLMAQFPIGHISINFNDSARTGGTSISGAASTGTGRAIGTEVYYPAISAGNNTPVATGKFPIVVFGHGFVMTYDAYTTLFDTLSANGYIVAMVTTEGSVSPVHLDFGKDLAKVVDELLLLNSNNINSTAISPFISKLNGRAAIGGHSMGGGSSFLSDQFTANTICYFNFAAAETNPSAVTAAASITKPELVFSGTYDCVAPPATNQTLMYNALISACKQQVNITKAYHCEFADASFTCGFGEGTCITPGGLSSVTEQQIVRRYLEPYLDYYLKGVCPAWIKFQNLVDTATIVTVTQSCINVVPVNAGITGDTAFCTASSVTLAAIPTGFKYIWSNSAVTDSINVNTPGNYSVIVGNVICQLPATATNITQLDTPVVSITQQSDTLTFQSVPTAVSATWYNSSGIITGSGFSFSPLNAGTYYVVTIDSAGCKGSSNAVNFIATDAGFINDISITISPNPASSVVHLLVANEWKNASIKMTDVAGRVVLTQSINSSDTFISLDKLNKGIYIVSLSSASKILTRKLVVD